MNGWIGFIYQIGGAIIEGVTIFFIIVYIVTRFDNIEKRFDKLEKLIKKVRKNES